MRGVRRSRVADEGGGWWWSWKGTARLGFVVRVADVGGRLRWIVLVGGVVLANGLALLWNLFCVIYPQLAK